MPFEQLGHEPRSVQPGELLYKGVQPSLTELTLQGGDGVAEKNGGASAEEHEVVQLRLADEPLQHLRRNRGENCGTQLSSNI